MKERLKEKLTELCNDVRMNCGREADISPKEIEDLVDDFIIELDKNYYIVGKTLTEI